MINNQCLRQPNLGKDAFSPTVFRPDVSRVGSHSCITASLASKVEIKTLFCGSAGFGMEFRELMHGLG
jgi:hypothetical protein